MIALLYYKLSINQILKIQDFKTPLVESLNHERYVTGLIHTLYDAAYQDKDFRAVNLQIGLFLNKEKKKKMPTI